MTRTVTDYMTGLERDDRVGRWGRTPIGYTSAAWDYEQPRGYSGWPVPSSSAWRSSSSELTRVEEFDLDLTPEPSEVDLDDAGWAPRRPALHPIAADELEDRDERYYDALCALIATGRDYA